MDPMVLLKYIVLWLGIVVLLMARIRR